MLSDKDAHLALRSRLLSLVVATTGSMSLVATTTGYARASGSFLTDGFAVGMEIVPAGFPANPVDVITFVDATTITTKNTHASATSASGRSITVGVPVTREFDNKAVTRIAGRPYITEQYDRATNDVFTTASNGGHAEVRGLYVVTWYGIEDTGVSALHAAMDALTALFASGTRLTAGSNSLRVLFRPGPQAGQIRHTDDGWAYRVLTISWSALVQNAVAA